MEREFKRHLKPDEANTRLCQPLFEKGARAPPPNSLLGEIITHAVSLFVTKITETKIEFAL